MNVRMLALAVVALGTIVASAPAALIRWDMSGTVGETGGNPNVQVGEAVQFVATWDTTATPFLTGGFQEAIYPLIDWQVTLRDLTVRDSGGSVFVRQNSFGWDFIRFVTGAGFLEYEVVLGADTYLDHLDLATLTPPDPDTVILKTFQITGQRGLVQGEITSIHATVVPEPVGVGLGCVIGGCMLLKRRVRGRALPAVS